MAVLILHISRLNSQQPALWKIPVDVFSREETNKHHCVAFDDKAYAVLTDFEPKVVLLAFEFLEMR